MREQLSHQASDERILKNVAAKAQSTSSSTKRNRPRAIPFHWYLPGFGGKSKVQTSLGQMPIEMLRRNDPVKVKSGTFLKVSWIDSICLDHEFLASNPQAQPILVPAGSLGQGKPLADMLVSPAQSIEASAHIGVSALKPASELIGRCRISTKPQTAFTYFLFGCEAVNSVCVDGVWCRTSPAPNK